MKVMNITNVEKFFSVIDQCEGKIELVTENGDKFNLKSKIGQYASLAKVFFGGRIPSLEIIAHSPSDRAKLIHYMMHMYE